MVERLCGDLAEIEEVLGRDTALAFAKAFDGRVLTIPSSAPYDGPLTPMLAEIEGLIGRDLTLIFAEAFGGSSVYIPGVGARSDGTVQAVIGPEATAKLAEGFGDLKIVVPQSPRMQRSYLLNTRVKALLTDGLSVDVIAGMTGVTERNVRKIARRYGLRRSRQSDAGYVRKRLRQGATVQAVVLELGVTEAAVRREQSFLRRRRIISGPAAEPEGGVHV